MTQKISKKAKISMVAMTEAELKSDLKRLRGQIVRAKLNVAAKKEKNSRQVFAMRKQVARILTLLRAKELVAKAKKVV